MVSHPAATPLAPAQREQLLDDLEESYDHCSLSEFREFQAAEIEPWLRSLNG